METGTATKPWVGKTALVVLLGALGFLGLLDGGSSGEYYRNKARAETTALEYEAFITQYFSNFGLRTTLPFVLWHPTQSSSLNYGEIVNDSLVVGHYKVEYFYQGNGASPHSLKFSYTIKGGLTFQPGLFTGVVPKDLVAFIAKATPVRTTEMIDGRPTHATRNSDGTVQIEFSSALPGVGIGSTELSDITRTKTRKRRVSRSIVGNVQSVLANCEVGVLTSNLANDFEAKSFVILYGKPKDSLFASIGDTVVACRADEHKDYWSFRPENFGKVSEVSRRVGNVKATTKAELHAGHLLTFDGKYYELPNGIVVASPDDYLQILIPQRLIRD